MIDYSKYIGIPWVSNGRDLKTGLDCWGIVWEIYFNEYSVRLPSLKELDVLDQGYEETERKLEEKLLKGLHEEFEEVNEYKEGDLIYMRIAGHPVHVGTVLDKRYMIHTTKSTGSVLERYNTPNWKRRILAVYRHKALK